MTGEQSTIQQNIEFFEENERYMQAQASMDIYRYMRLMAEKEIRGARELLDVGNGGFFNYDTILAKHVTAVDLFLKEGPGSQPNTSLVPGSILNLPFDADRFDCVLLQNVFHHVTGPTVASNYQNMRTSMAELYRVTQPEGKCVVLENTVGSLFCMFERVVYAPAARIKRTGHPMTFQFTADQLKTAALAVGFALEEYAIVPRGRWLIQFGYTWPSVLTPARPVKLVLRKRGGR